MKKTFIVFTCLASFNKSDAQIVFCPPGAEWHYTFSWYWVDFVHQQYVKRTDNEPVKYTGDSIVDAQPVKILKHEPFFTGSCYAIYCAQTLIKQNGDTVFMRNAATNHAWQVLYNFDAVMGDSWENTFTNGLSYTVTVDSTGYVSANNFNLKRMYVRYKVAPPSSPFPAYWMPPSMITERLGSNGYLFNFHTNDCDGPSNFEANLCYKDAAFGLKQFTNLPCDYSSLYTGLERVNLSERSLVKVYPNPTTNLLKVEFELSARDEAEIIIINRLGQVIYQLQNAGIKQDIDLSALSSGVYFLKVRTSLYDKVLKIVKENP